jgi:hypothetical protein
VFVAGIQGRGGDRGSLADFLHAKYCLVSSDLGNVDDWRVLILVETNKSLMWRIATQYLLFLGRMCLKWSELFGYHSATFQPIPFGEF